jgi:nucleoside-diphosphate-sugar epimerase
MKSGHILITGATGFLGSAVVDNAINSGLAVTATDRVITKKELGIRFVTADILDSNSLSKIFKGIDCVCHVAGLAHVFNRSEAMAASFYAVNVKGSENVAHAAVRAGVGHFIFISSVSVYGGVAHCKDEHSECYPEDPYAQSKWQAERCLVELCQKEGINLTILRLTTLYGEGDPGNMARLIDTINRRRFIWVGKGENLKSLLHFEDAARACVVVMSAPPTGINLYNVSAPPVRMRDIVEAIVFSLGKAVPVYHISSSTALASAKILKNISFNCGCFVNVHDKLQKWLANDCYDTVKFCNTFAYQPKVSLQEGIHREVEWYKKQQF